MAFANPHREHGLCRSTFLPLALRHGDDRLCRLDRRRQAQADRLIQFYGMGPEYAANLRANIGSLDAATLSRLEAAPNDVMRRMVAAQLPDGATGPLHYHSRR